MRSFAIARAVAVALLSAARTGGATWRSRPAFSRRPRFCSQRGCVSQRRAPGSARRVATVLGEGNSRGRGV
eukprot:11186989-Lingulodinium_polyedra.AAC.1